jgi:hypothetical protein
VARAGKAAPRISAGTVGDAGVPPALPVAEQPVLLP